MIRFLLWVGVIARKHNGKIALPFAAPPRWCWRSWRDFKHYAKFCGPFYVFRNLDHVTKWVPGRLLPRRWGFGIYGFEFGDRGH